MEKKRRRGGGVIKQVLRWARFARRETLLSALGSPVISGLLQPSWHISHQLITRAILTNWAEASVNPSSRRSRCSFFQWLGEGRGGAGLIRADCVSEDDSRHCWWFESKNNLSEVWAEPGSDAVIIGGSLGEESCGLVLHI